MHSNSQALLHHNLPLDAQKAYTYPALSYRSLISVGQLCDLGYSVVFDNKTVKAVNNTTKLVDLKGTQDLYTGLYHTPMTPTVDPDPTPSNKTQTTNNVYSMRTKADLVQYLHQECWSPTPHTWYKAIKKGFFATLPGLTAQLVQKHLLSSKATVKGHMKLTRQHIRSTKTKPTETTAMTALPASDETQANMVSLKTVDLIKPTSKVATDQTGRFPVKSSRGNQYIMVAYVHDANAILVRPIKNQSQHSLVNAYNRI